MRRGQERLGRGWWCRSEEQVPWVCGGRGEVGRGDCWRGQEKVGGEEQDCE